MIQSASAPVIPGNGSVLPLLLPTIPSAEKGQSTSPKICKPSLQELATKPRGKLRIHKGCQTDVSELAELKAVQENLNHVRSELASVKHELKHAEQRLRHEMREELQNQLQYQGARCADKMQFMRKKADTHVSQVRAACRSRLGTEMIRHTKEMHLESERVSDELRMPSRRRANRRPTI